jgi:hypothetical protein
MKKWPIIHVKVSHGGGHMGHDETYILVNPEYYGKNPKKNDPNIEYMAEDFANNFRNWIAEWEMVDSIPKEWVDKKVKRLQSSIEHQQKQIEIYKNSIEND